MWYLVLSVVVLFLVVGRFFHYRRVVTKRVPVSDLEDNLWFDIICGRNGTRLCIYHRESDTIVEVVKSLTPSYSRSGTVRLQVVKSRIPRPTQWRIDRARKSWLRGLRYETVMVWSWDLPSPDQGKRLSEVDCGASYARMLEAVREAIPKDEGMADPLVYVWGKVNPTGRPMGAFDDL
jgi:hypothetical protein